MYGEYGKYLAYREQLRKEKLLEDAGWVRTDISSSGWKNPLTGEVEETDAAYYMQELIDINLILEEQKDGL